MNWRHCCYAYWVLMLFSSFHSPNRREVPSGRGMPAIYLNFDGEAVAHPDWNHGIPFRCAPSGLCPEDQAYILRRVGEAYAPFRVRVSADRADFDRAPRRRRVEVIFTPTSAWYGDEVGGTATLGSFFGPPSPCFVFTDELDDLHALGEAAAHEVGHTLGLDHQSLYDSAGCRVDEYNYGRNGHAPIMGVSYYVPKGEWWVGPTEEGPHTRQDDYRLLLQRLGPTTWK